MTQGESEDPSDEFLVRVMRYLDGQLDEASVRALETELYADAEKRSVLLDVAEHATAMAESSENSLMEMRELSHDAEGLAGHQAVVPASGRSVWKYVACVAATAALVMIGIELVPRAGFGSKSNVDDSLVPATDDHTNYVATLTRVLECQWKESSGSIIEGMRLTTESLRLETGLAEIVFDSGAALILKGPADLRIDGPTSATVFVGDVVFRGDQTTSTFQLRTPSSTLIDHGTEYALSVDQDGEEVHVFDGEVRRLVRDDTSEQITTGRAKTYAAGSVSPGADVDLRPDGFVRSLPSPGINKDQIRSTLLASESFSYQHPQAIGQRHASGGVGWRQPWTAWRWDDGEMVVSDEPLIQVERGLFANGTPRTPGMLEHHGHSWMTRRLAEPVRVDQDAVYYFSFLFQFDEVANETSSSPDSVMVVLRSTNGRDVQSGPSDFLQVGISARKSVLYAKHAGRSSRSAMPLVAGETYRLVGKIAASKTQDDQLLATVLRASQPVDLVEPEQWMMIGPTFAGDQHFSLVRVSIHSWRYRYRYDELRIGTSWQSVVVPVQRAGAR